MNSPKRTLLFIFFLKQPMKSIYTLFSKILKNKYKKDKNLNYNYLNLVQKKILICIKMENLFLAFSKNVDFSIITKNQKILLDKSVK